jgi:hypothetical protein
MPAVGVEPGIILILNIYIYITRPPRQLGNLTSQHNFKDDTKGVGY